MASLISLYKLQFILEVLNSGGRAGERLVLGGGVYISYPI